MGISDGKIILNEGIARGGSRSWFSQSANRQGFDRVEGEPTNPFLRVFYTEYSETLGKRLRQ